VRAAFAALRPADQELLRLLAWDGLTRAEAAQVLDCNPASFAVRLHRAGGGCGPRLTTPTDRLWRGDSAARHLGGAMTTELDQLAAAHPSRPMPTYTAG